MKEVWGPSALFGSVSVVAGFVTLLLPETGDSNLSEPTNFSATKEVKDVTQYNSISKTEATKAHENMSYVAED